MHGNGERVEQISSCHQFEIGREEKQSKNETMISARRSTQHNAHVRASRSTSLAKLSSSEKGKNQKTRAYIEESFPTIIRCRRVSLLLIVKFWKSILMSFGNRSS